MAIRRLFAILVVGLSMILVIGCASTAAGFDSPTDTPPLAAGVGEQYDDEDEFEEETPLVESDPSQYYTPARGQTYYPEEMSFVFLQGRTYLHFKVEGIDYLTPAGGGYMSVQLRGTISTAVHINGTGSAEIRTTSYSAYDAWKQAEIKAENWERTPPPPIGTPKTLMP